MSEISDIHDNETNKGNSNSYDNFVKGLDDLTEKHIEYFKNRHPRFSNIPNHKHDNCKSHIDGVISSGNVVTIHIMKDSDLREDIKQEIKHLCDQCYGGMSILD